MTIEELEAARLARLNTAYLQAKEEIDYIGKSVPQIALADAEKVWSRLQLLVPSSEVTKVLTSACYLSLFNFDPFEGQVYDK